MSAIFRARKTYFVNLQRINLEDGSVIDGGTKCSFRVKLTGMLRGVEGDEGVPNGQIAEYKAQLKIQGNEIYAVRDLTINNLTNSGNVGSEEYDDGERHTATVKSKCYNLNVFHMLKITACRMQHGINYYTV